MRPSACAVVMLKRRSRLARSESSGKASGAGTDAVRNKTDEIEETQTGVKPTPAASERDEANGSSAASPEQTAPTGGGSPRSVIPPQLLLERSKGASAEAGAFVARETKGVVRTFLDVRGTHLAALIAFYGLLAFFPLILIGLAVAGLIGEQKRIELPDRTAQSNISWGIRTQARDDGERVP